MEQPESKSGNSTRLAGKPRSCLFSYFSDKSQGGCIFAFPQKEAGDRSSDLRWKVRYPAVGGQRRHLLPCSFLKFDSFCQFLRYVLFVYIAGKNPVAGSTEAGEISLGGSASPAPQGLVSNHMPTLFPANDACKQFMSHTCLYAPSFNLFSIFYLDSLSLYSPLSLFAPPYLQSWHALKRVWSILPFLFVVCIYLCVFHLTLFCPSACLSKCLPVCNKVHLSICLSSVRLSV